MRPRLIQHIPNGPTGPFVVYPKGEGPAGPGHYWHIVCRECNNPIGACEPGVAPDTFSSTGRIDPIDTPAGPLYNYEPEWLVHVPKSSKHAAHTPQRIANLAAGKGNNAGLGLIYLTLWDHGRAAFSCCFACNSQIVLCVWTTDPAIQPVEHPAILDPDGWRQRAMTAIEEARAARAAYNPDEPQIPLTEDAMSETATKPKSAVQLKKAHEIARSKLHKHLEALPALHKAEADAWSAWQASVAPSTNGPAAKSKADKDEPVTADA